MWLNERNFDSRLVAAEKKVADLEMVLGRVVQDFYDGGNVPKDIPEKFLGVESPEVVDGITIKPSTPASQIYVGDVPGSVTVSGGAVITTTTNLPPGMPLTGPAQGSGESLSAEVKGLRVMIDHVRAQRDELQLLNDRQAKEIERLEIELQAMTEERDDWRQEQADTEDFAAKLQEEFDEYKDSVRDKLAEALDTL